MTLTWLDVTVLTLVLSVPLAGSVVLWALAVRHSLRTSWQREPKRVSLNEEKTAQRMRER